MRRSHGWHGRTGVRGTIGGLLAALVLLVLAAPASAAPPLCSDLTLDDVHLGGSVAGQIACTDPEDDPLTYVVTAPPAHGSASVGFFDGSVSYVAASDFAGPDPFTVTADDGQGGTDTVQVSVEVTNSAPVCRPVDLGTASHGPFAGLFGNVDCDDPDGDFFTDYEIVEQGAHGQAAAQFGSLSYDPEDDFVGEDSFTYRVRDGAAWSEPATATVELTNTAPECSQPGTLTIRRDKPASAQVQCFDNDNDPLELVVVDAPAHGDISAAPGPFNSLVATYDPDDGYQGADHMRLRVSDGFVESNAFDVDLNITPNHAPECSPFTTHARVAEPTTVFTAFVCNDVDYQDDDLSVALDPAAGPDHGDLEPDGGDYTYTSVDGYVGPDDFGITASDGGLTTHATMRLHVADTAFCSPAPTLQIRPGRQKGVDVECTSPDFGFPQSSIVTQPTKGTVTQSFGFQEFLYTANAGASGADSFTFRAGTGELESPVATQNVVIDAAFNQPPECNDEFAMTAYPSRDAFVFPFCSDPDFDPLTYTVSRAPNHGTTRTEFGSIVYTAAAGYTGADDLEITVNDGHGAIVTITQLIDVRQPLAPGCAPVQPITARPGGKRTVILGCTNPQGDLQSYSIHQQGQKGTVTAGDFPGQFRYTAATGTSGGDQFVLRVSNAVGATDVPVDVTLDEAWNTAPYCNSLGSTITVARGIITDLPLASRCTDDEGDAITFTRSAQAQHGTVSAGPAATLQYTADAVYTGFDSFAFTPTDSRGLAGVDVFLSLNVVASLDPTCTPQPAIGLRPGATRTVSMVCQDPAGAPLTYEIVTGPAKGTLTPSGDSTSAFRNYTANAGASGADSFTYRARSSNGTSTTYTQSITIDPNANTAPSCTPNGGFPTAVAAGRASQVTPPFCSDADLDTLTFQHVTQPQHGTVATANGVMTYTPVAGYTGPDQFTYTVSDGRVVAGPNTVNLQVVPVTPPSCEEPDPIGVRPSAPPRSVPVDCTDPLGEPFAIVIDDEPQHGTITMFADRPLYDADSGYTGPDAFSYHAENENGSSETVTQEITVDPNANTAPECFSGFVKVKPGVARQVTPPCFDADGDPLSFEIETQPAHGTVSPQSGTGFITYTAEQGYTGPDAFTVTVEDGHGGSDTGTVTLNVSTANTPPSCFSSMQIFAQSGSATFLPAPPCADDDDDPLTFEIVDEPDHGTITEQNGNRFYTPDAGYTGPDSFTFRANDGLADSNIASVSVTVTPPPGPVCQPRSYSVPADGTLDVDLDCFANGQDVQLAIQTPPPAAAGTLGPIDQANDSVRFTPDADFRGQTTFTFAGSSGGQTSAPATITITVTGRGFPPAVTLSPSTYGPRTGVPVTFTASASDPDGGAIAGYRWFVDDAEVPGETASTLSRSFATGGNHSVRVRVTDDEGDVTERTVAITAHEGNQLPQVWLDVPAKAGTGAPVRMSAWAWDPEGAIAEYSWDFGDGSPVQEGAALREVTHTYATPGTKTVELTVTDGEGATVTQEATIEITDANTAPALDLFVWPEPALRGQATVLFADVADEENDPIGSVDWDLDGNGTYETDGGTATQRSHTFTTTGDFPIGVRVEDGRGATSTATRTVHVVNAPPLAKIAGPSVLDLGTTGTYTDASTDDGSITSRAWDTDDDGVFDDGTSPSVQLAAGDATGYKVLRLRVTDNEGEVTTVSRTITVRPDGPVVISDPVPPPLPGGGGTVNIGTSTDPTSGSTTITIPSGQVSQFPNRCMPLDIDVTIRKAAGATVLNPVLVLTTPGGGTERFPMTDANGDGTWTAHLDCAVAGTLKVEYTIKAPDGTEESFVIPVGKIVLIDPQGVVHDRAAFEAHRAAHPAATDDEARAATAIAGATVHLQRLVGGSWVDVNASDPGIDPNVNPQVTGANGLYKWDVSDGTYRVRRQRARLPALEETSDPVVIPPPVLDLHIGLDRNPAPEAAIDAAGEAFRGQTVTFTSDSSDDGSIAAQRWDLDDDGNFDDGTAAAVSRSFTSLGAKTVRLQVTDDEGVQRWSTRRRRRQPRPDRGGVGRSGRGRARPGADVHRHGRRTRSGSRLARPTRGTSTVTASTTARARERALTFADARCEDRARAGDGRRRRHGDGRALRDDRQPGADRRAQRPEREASAPTRWRRGPRRGPGPGPAVASVTVGHGRRRPVRRRHGRLEERRVRHARHEGRARTGCRPRRRDGHGAGHGHDRQPRPDRLGRRACDRVPRPGPDLHGDGRRRRSGSRRAHVRVGLRRRRPVRRRHRRLEGRVLRLAGRPAGQGPRDRRRRRRDHGAAHGHDREPGAHRRDRRAGDGPPRRVAAVHGDRGRPRSGCGLAHVRVGRRR